MTGVTRAELPVAPVSEMAPELTAAQQHEQKQAATVKIMEDLHAIEIFGTPELSKEFIDEIEYQPPHQSFRDRLLEHSFEQA